MQEVPLAPSAGGGGLAMYHVAAALYEPGDRILPGNWGRLVLGGGPNHTFFYREALLELIRRQEFAEQPSRLRCVFAFEDLQRAAAFRSGHFVYRVEPADPHANRHRVDMTWLDAVNETHSVAGALNCFRRYWRGEANMGPGIVGPGWEFLVEGEFVVMQRITRVREDQ